MSLRILTISLLSLLSFSAIAQAPSPIDTLFHEKFDPPSGPDSVTTYNVVAGNTDVWNDSNQFYVSSPMSYHAQTVPFDVLYFQTDTFSTEGKVFIRLQFDQICKVYFLNKGIVEVSVDSGQTWSALDSNHYKGNSLTFNTLGYFNEIGYNAPSLTPYWGGPTTVLPGVSPQQSWWAHETFDISSIAGTIHPNGDTGYSHVQVRWGLHHVSTQNVIHGWNVDNILIEGAPCELEKPILNWNLIPQKLPIGARYQNSVQAKVEVTDNTGIDSTVVYWSKNGGAWQDTLMSPSSTLSCTGSSTTIQFSHLFSGLTLGDTIDWYIESYDCACPNFTRDPIATATPDYYTFWIDPSPPAICGPATPSSFPFVAQVPYVENFDGSKWIFGSGDGTTGTTHRGSFPVGNPPTGENWTVAPTEVTPGYGWSIRNTATNTNQTGPNNDNTTGYGKFLYTEADQGSLNNLTQLITPCIDLSNSACAGLEFYYHMYGNHVNLMRLDVDTGDATPKWVNNIWKQTGPVQTKSSDPFQRAFVDLKQFGGKIIRIRFIGKRGNGVKGDMAIDDIRVYEPNPYDVEVVSYYTPQNGYCSYSTNDSVTMKVRTTGCLTLSKIPVGYDVTHLGTGTTVTQWDTIFGSMETGFDTIYKFGIGANLTAYGNYNVSVFTSLAGDNNSSNDTVGPIFIKHEQPYSNFPFIERYDSSPWAPGNGTTQNPGTMDTTLFVPSPASNSGYYAFMVGTDLTPTSATGPRRDRSYNGNYIYGEGDFGNGNTNALLVSRCMDLTGMTSPILDFFYHAYGTDAGAINFQIIKPGENNWSVIPGGAVAQPQQAAEKDNWKYKKVDLSTWAGEIIKVRMIVQKAGAGTQADIAIDDFGIYDRSNTDVGVTIISPPNARINQLAPVKPTFVIRNFGKSSVSNIPITYTITPICGPNAGVPVTYTTTYTGSIGVDAAVSHTPSTLPLYPDGDFEICATTNKTGDNNSHNDEVCKRSVGWPEKFIQTGFFEDFDNCLTGGSEIGFFPSGDLGLFEIGTPSNNPINTAGSSPNSYMTGLDFDYYAGKSEQLNLPRLTGFDTIARAELRFGHSFDLGAGDAAVFQYLQGSTWTTLGFPGSNFCPTWYNQGNIPILMNGPGWQNASSWDNTCWPLSLWDFSSASLISRFSLVSGTSNGAGWAVDDIEIYIPPQNSASPIDINSEEYIIIPYQDNHIYTVIENTGGKKLTECLVQYRVDGGAYSTPELVTFSPPLWPGFKRKYTFNQIWQSPAPGPHDVCVLTSRPNAKQDNLISDDTLCVVLNTLDLIDMTVDSSYCNDFEDPTQVSWVTLNTFYNNQGLTSWDFGTPNQAPISGAFSGTNAWMTDLTDNYKLRDSSALITPVFKVDSGVVYNMNFMHSFKSELYHDGGCVEATYDGINWYNVGDGFIDSRWHNIRHVTSLDILKSGWSGNSHSFTWQNSNLNIAFDGDRNVVFRFRFGSDHSFEYTGWAVDDFCFEQGTGAKDVFIGVDDFNKTLVGIGNLIPNPSSGFTYVPIITASTGDIKVIAYNMVGQVMMDETYHYESGEGRIDFDVTTWTPGVYIVAFELEGTIHTRKLVVQ